MSDPSNDYLWDRSGDVDPQTRELERELGAFAHDGRPLRSSANETAETGRGRLVRWLVAASAAAAVVTLAVWMLWQPDRSTVRPDSFHVYAPATDRVIASGGTFVALEGNQVLELGTVGRVELGIGSALRVVRASDDEALLRLDIGEMHAVVAPDLVAPRFFQVDTPSARCVDLGCEYDLTVDEAGDARVVVTLGQVAFERDERDVLIPQGAECRAAAELGLGTPHFSDVEPRLAKLIFAFDRTTDPQRRRDVGEKLAFSIDRPRDSLTLWHLLRDPNPEIAALAGQAMVRLVGHPDGPNIKGAPPVDASTWREFLRAYW